MAHFYGVIKGTGKTESTRCGTKKTELTTTAASWDGAIKVNLYYDEETKKNKFTVYQRRWHGNGVEARIADGIVGES